MGVEVSGRGLGVAAFVSIVPAANVLPMCGVLWLPFVAVLPAVVISEGVHRGFVALADVCRDFIEKAGLAICGRLVVWCIHWDGFGQVRDPSLP